MKLTFLGTGTSHGIPVITCNCKVCTSDDPRNTRTRSALMVYDGQTRIVVDTGPDFRMQMLREQVKTLDAILITHAHADHLNGIDDLRVFTWHKPLPFYASEGVLEEVRRRFDYIFHNTVPGGGKPNLAVEVVPPEGFTIGTIPIRPVPIFHGCRTIYGYRIGDAAYLTDCSGIPETSLPLLEGLDTLILGALRYRPHPTHFSVDQAVAASRSIGARRTYLTHFCHDIEHAELADYLPKGIMPARDGLVIRVENPSQARKTHGDVYGKEPAAAD